MTFPGKGAGGLLTVATILVVAALPARSDQPVVWTEASTGITSFLPVYIALNQTGSAFVSNPGHTGVLDQIDRLTTNGVFEQSWGRYGTGAANMKQPKGLAVASSGHLYVVDSGNSRIQVYTPVGGPVMSFGSSVLNNPVALDIAAGDTVFVVDQGDEAVKVFTGGGAFVRQVNLGGVGSLLTQGPFDIVLNAQRMYLTGEVAGSAVVLECTTGGAFIRSWSGSGLPGGGFGHAKGLGIDGVGNIYVADHDNNRVQVFDSTGVFLTAWGSSGAGLGQLSSPTDLCVDGAGRVYVVDSGNARIQVFDPQIAAVGEDLRAGGLQLAPVSPNPSRNSSELRFDLARESSNVSLAIYDVGGRRVAGWEWPVLTAGSHQIEWNGMAKDGRPVGAGLLFCQLTANGQTRTQKLVHLR